MRMSVVCAAGLELLALVGVTLYLRELHATVWGTRLMGTVIVGRM
tara:strand:- start:130 stop:264 length:135 start_codon:yes stop_codon:yes gene_type:complete